MEKMINRNAVVRAVSDEEVRSAEFVISSEAIDSYGTVFKLDGWQLERYMQNPIVTYNHSLGSDDPDTIIGTSEVFVEGDKLIGRVIFESAEDNDLADKVFRKVKRGVLKMASVGAIPKKWSIGNKEKGEDPDVLYFNEQELIEWSIVPVGANPDAHKRNAEVIEDYRSDLIKEIEVQVETVTKNRSAFEAQLVINKNKVK